MELTKQRIVSFMMDTDLRKQLPTKEEYSALYWVVHFYEVDGHVCYYNFCSDTVYSNHRELERKGFVNIIRNKGKLKSSWLMGKGSNVRFDYTVTPTQIGYDFIKITQNWGTLMEDVNKTKIKKKTFVKREVFFKQLQDKNASEWENDL